MRRSTSSGCYRMRRSGPPNSLAHYKTTARWRIWSCSQIPSAAPCALLRYHTPDKVHFHLVAPRAAAPGGLRLTSAYDGEVRQIARVVSPGERRSGLYRAWPVSASGRARTARTHHSRPAVSHYFKAGSSVGSSSGSATFVASTASVVPGKRVSRGVSGLELLVTPPPITRSQQSRRARCCAPGNLNGRPRFVCKGFHHRQSPSAAGKDPLQYRLDTLASPTGEGSRIRRNHAARGARVGVPRGGAVAHMSDCKQPEQKTPADGAGPTKRVRASPPFQLTPATSPTVRRSGVLMPTRRSISARRGRQSNRPPVCEPRASRYNWCRARLIEAIAT